VVVECRRPRARRRPPLHLSDERHRKARSGLDTWPINGAGRDLSNSESYAEAIGLFAYGSREPFFAAYEPKSRTGVAHWADPKDMPGKKMWSWGAGADLPYRTRLSDDHSAYVEIQAGLLPSQDQFAFLEPQQSRIVTEWWLPVHDLGGVTRAGHNAILFLQRPKEPANSMHLEIAALRKLAGATVTLSSGSTVLFQQTPT
jgi:hypothetical protein